MSSILITGCNGFLGQHLTLFFAAKGFNVIAVGRAECRIKTPAAFIYESIDLTNHTAVNNCLQKHTPSVIIHAAAMSKPDECNNNKNLCLLQNVEVTKFLIESALAFAPHFIYISTDFIFGEDGPHAENDTPNPLNYYGETKLMAEQLVKKSGLLYTIVRPVFIYGKMLEGMRPSFLHWVKNSLEQHKPIKVVSDQQRTPTYVEDICKGILSIITKQKMGEYHLAGKDILSPYQMAVTVAYIFGLDASLIENVTSSSFPEPVKRAKKSGLNITKAINQLSYQPVAFNEGVKLSFTN